MGILIRNNNNNKKNNNSNKNTNDENNINTKKTNQKVDNRATTTLAVFGTTLGRWKFLLLSCFALLSLLCNALNVLKYYTTNSHVVASSDGTALQQRAAPPAPQKPKTPSSENHHEEPGVAEAGGLARSIDDDDVGSSEVSVVPPCTRYDQQRPWPRRDNITQVHYKRVRQAEEIVAFLATELHGVDAPLTLLYGTALREYRNGADSNCVQVSFKEDDYDVGVLKQHVHYVVMLLDDIRERWQWKVHERDFIKKGIIILLPPGQAEVKAGFQIDIYSLEVDVPRKGLVHKTWDGFRMASDALFPLLKHKPIAVPNSNEGAGNVSYSLTPSSIPFLYMPFDPPCYLANIYGEDFMTPKAGFKPLDANLSRYERYDHPTCTRTLTKPQRIELDRQMSLVNNQTYAMRWTADYIMGRTTTKKNE